MVTNSSCLPRAGAIAYAEKHPPFKELLVHFSSLLCAQRDMADRLCDAFTDADLSNDAVALAGEPVAMSLAPALFLSAFRRSAQSIWPLMGKEFPMLQSPLRALEKQIMNDDWCMDCLRAAVRGEAEGLEQAAKTANVPPEVLLTALRAAYGPCISALRPKLAGQSSVVLWRKCFCPICGSDPDIGTLELHPEEGDFVVSTSGQAWLHCPQCEQHWRFTRVLCPACGNKENDKLVRLSLPETPNEHIYACDACRRYLPCLDLTALPDGDGGPDLYFAALKLVHLDAIAQEHGYTPLSPVPWATFGFVDERKQTA